VAITIANLAKAPKARLVIAEHPSCLRLLLGLLASGDPFGKYWAAQAFSVLGEGGSVISEGEVAEASRKSYAKLMETDCMRQLIIMLQDPLPLPRRGAAETLGKLCCHEPSTDEVLAHGGAGLLVTMLGPEEDMFGRDCAIGAILVHIW